MDQGRNEETAEKQPLRSGKTDTDSHKWDKNDLKSTIRNLEGLMEVAVLTLIYYLIWRYFYRGLGFPYYGRGKYVLALVYAFLMSVLFLGCDGFQYGHMKLIDVVISQWISILILNTVTYLQLCLILNRMVTPFPMVLLSGIDFIAAFILSSLYSVLYHKFYVPKHMLMIYGNENAVTLKLKMDLRRDKYRVEELLSIRDGVGRIREEIPRYDAVVINDVPARERNDILKFCYQEGIRTYVVPKISDIILGGATDITLFDTPLLLVRGRGLTLGQRIAKRAMDIILCLVALIPGLPVMLLIAAAIKLEDRGPVFYRQKRVTRDGKVFDILKFRSMIVDAEKDGKPHPATDGDPRITKVGKVIRSLRLDELPQIFNILKGDMSIVGPRPERVEHVEIYTKEVPEFACRFKVKGGLTGYAQIYGKYNTDAYDKLKLDLMYIEDYSFLLDIKLILMTIRVMLKPESTEGFDKAEEMERKREELISAEAGRAVQPRDV